LSPYLDSHKDGGIGCLPPCSVYNAIGLRVLSFPILLKTEECCCGVDGCNLSNTDDFGLDVALSPLSSLASSASQLVMTKVRLLTLRKPLVFMSKLIMRFMREGRSFELLLLHPGN